MKKNILLLILLILFCTSETTLAEENLCILVEGKPISTQYLVEQGRTLVALRGTTEALGFKVEWLKKTQQILLSNNYMSICLKINSNIAAVSMNGNVYSFRLDVAPKLIEGSCYIPLRFISEVCLFDVYYDKNSNTISITKTSNKSLSNYIASKIIVTDSDSVTSIDTPQSNNSSVIESKIDDDFEGYDTDNIYKLANGQIWIQTSYHYDYHYSYRPDVIIYKSGSVYKMKVEGMDDTITVERLK